MKLHLGHVLATLALLAGSAAGPAAAQTVPAKIAVSSPTLKTGEPMGRDYTPDGRNVSPPLSWSGVPAGTKELAVVCADFGAGAPPPWVHWIIYNIPATAKGLPDGVPIDPAAPMPSRSRAPRKG